MPRAPVAACAAAATIVRRVHAPPPAVRTSRTPIVAILHTRCTVWPLLCIPTIVLSHDRSARARADIECHLRRFETMTIVPTATSSRYEPPVLIRVHVDPVKELLLQTNCQPTTATGSGGPMPQRAPGRDGRTTATRTNATPVRQSPLFRPTHHSRSNVRDNDPFFCCRGGSLPGSPGGVRQGPYAATRSLGVVRLPDCDGCERAAANQFYRAGGRLHDNLEQYRGIGCGDRLRDSRCSVPDAGCEWAGGDVYAQQPFPV